MHVCDSRCIIPNHRVLTREAELGTLEEEVGVLAPGHLMQVDVGGARLLPRLEGRVEAAALLPVLCLGVVQGSRM